MNRMKLVSPVDARAADAVRLATRLDDLSGCRLGLLDNRKGNANVLLEMLAAQLSHDGAVSGRLLEKRIFSRPATAENLAELASSSDAVLTAVGD